MPMPMLQKRRTKKIIVLEEFVQKINDGQLLSGSLFPTTAELMRTYDISNRTAGGIIRGLSKMGLLDTAKGRRSVVKSECKFPLNPRFDKPIGIIVPGAAMFRHVAWRDWLAAHFQERLRRDGFQARLIPEDFDQDSLAACSGVIVAGELLCDQKWDEIQISGLPYVGLSFAKPLPDIVYVDYRHALDELALHLAASGCRKFVHVSSFEREARTVFGWYAKIGFFPIIQAYGVDHDGCYHPVVPPDQEACEAAFKPILGGAKEKAAILVTGTAYHSIIMDMMKRHSRRLGRHYELVSLSHVPHEKAPGCCIDLKCIEIADTMLTMLYRRQLQKRPQMGKIIQAEFHLHTPGDNR